MSSIDSCVFWGRSDKSKVIDKDTFNYHFDLIKLGIKYNYDYDSLKLYCEKDNVDYNFSTITTKLNIFGWIQLNYENKLEYNKFFDNFDNPMFFDYYMNYYLSFWQHKIDGNNYVKPYFLLLTVLQKLKNKGEDSYLTKYEFKKLFNQYQDITDLLIDEIIEDRNNNINENADQGYGTLGYSSKYYFKSSSLLNFDFSSEKKRKHYFVELANNKYINLKVNQLLLNNIHEDFFIVNNCSLSKRDQLKKDNSDWGKFLNNTNRFNRWFNMISIVDFKEYCEDESFTFSNDLIRRFILSLETKPFLILTGISGSGKTKIAELYGEYLIKNQRGSSIIIPIGSNWNDNKKLLGFKNPLIENKDISYQATDLVDFIKEANNNTDKTYIVILDEMNLSYTEKYFSDFLSALESRDNKIKLPNNNSIKWSHNLKIIGTINEDETTHTISPKVLDRANVIEMNGLIPSKYIDIQLIKSENRFTIFDYNFNIKEYKELLDNIYLCLNENFSFRIINEITEYMNTNKIYAEDKSMHELLDEQIYQKILPKIHGSKMDLPQKLSDLKTILQDTNESYENTIGKIDKMLYHVSIHGYSSFING